MAELEQLEKKRKEQENEWAILEQQRQTMMENAKRTLEKLTAQYEEKIKERKAALEKAQSAIKDLEKKSEELREIREPSSWPSEPMPEASSEPMPKAAENQEEQPKQVLEVVAGGSEQLQSEEQKDPHKKRRWY